MKYQNLPIAATYRRYRALAGKLRRSLKNQSFWKLSKEEQKELLLRLKRMYYQLSRVINTRKLKGAIAGGALLMSLGLGNANAQTFGSPVLTPFGLDDSSDAIYNPQLVDIDGDGDQDILANGYVSYEDNSVFFFENTGTPDAANFADPVADPFGIVSQDLDLTIFTFGDLDNDGDLDMISGKYYGSGVIYYENTGTAENPAFAAPVENPFSIQTEGESSAPTLVDLDDDGDLDLLLGTYFTDTEQSTFQYFENTGTAENPAFGPIQPNPFGLTLLDQYALVSDAVDIDNDGDFDLVIGGDTYILEGNDYRAFLGYIENTGTASAPAFGSLVTEPFGITFPNNTGYAIQTMADMDDDGDTDLLVFAYLYDEVAEDGTNGFVYFENLSPVSSILEIAYNDAALEVFPTTTRTSINWKFDLNETPDAERLVIYNTAGQAIHQTIINSSNGTIDLSTWSGGMYIVQLRNQQGQIIDSASVFKQ